MFGISHNEMPKACFCTPSWKYLIRVKKYLVNVKKLVSSPAAHQSKKGEFTSNDTLQATWGVMLLAQVSRVKTQQEDRTEDQEMIPVI